MERPWYRLILEDGFMMLEGPSKAEVFRAAENKPGSHVETCLQVIYFTDWQNIPVRELTGINLYD